MAFNLEKSVNEILKKIRTLAVQIEASDHDAIVIGKTFDWLSAKLAGEKARTLLSRSNLSSTFSLDGLTTSNVPVVQAPVHLDPATVTPQELGGRLAGTKSRKPKVDVVPVGGDDVDFIEE